MDILYIVYSSICKGICFNLWNWLFFIGLEGKVYKPWLFKDFHWKYSWTGLY